MKRLITIAAGLMVGIAIAAAAQADDFDYRAYGQWLDSNVGVEFHYSATHDRIELYRSRETRVTPVDGWLNATFRGGVYGHTTGTSVERKSGTVAITFREHPNDSTDYQFSADFGGAAGAILADIGFSGGGMSSHRVHTGNVWHEGDQRYNDTHDDKWALNGHAYADDYGGFTFLSAAFFNRGDTIAGQVDHYDWSGGPGFTGIIEADKE